MSFFASSGAWVAAIGLAAASPAPPRVVVWPQDGVEVSGDARVVEAAGFLPVSAFAPIEAARLEVREHTRKELDLVRADLDQAQSLYLEQDYVQMARVLAAAEQRALPLLALPGTCDALWELEFRRGLAALATLDGETTTARFRLAARLRPDRRPDPAYYGPDVAQAFSEAAEAERAAVRSPFGIEVAPRDATRFVDCAPAAAEVQLSPGLHVVWAVAPGYAAHAEVVDVSGASNERIRLEADPRRGAEALAVLPPEVPVVLEAPSSRPVVWQVVAAQDADALVWLREHGASWEAQLHVRDARGKVHREATRGEAVEAALTELSPQGQVVMVTPTVDQPFEPGRESKTPLVRKWWLWTVVGGVALTAVAVGLAFGLGGRAPSPSRQTIIVE